MPKVSTNARKISLKGTSSVMTRRKHYQMIKAQREQLDDELSSSSSSAPSFNEIRLVCYFHFFDFGLLVVFFSFQYKG